MVLPDNTRELVEKKESKRDLFSRISPLSSREGRNESTAGRRMTATSETLAASRRITMSSEAISASRRMTVVADNILAPSRRMTWYAREPKDDNF
jgi:hypothetical protein